MSAAHFKLLARGAQRVNQAVITALTQFGDRQVSVLSVCGAQGVGKSTWATTASGGIVNFPTGESHDHTTQGIDVALYEDLRTGRLILAIDSEGLQKNGTAQDQHLLTLLSSLTKVCRHIYLIYDTPRDADLESLKAMSHFSRENGQGIPTLAIGLRSKRKGSFDAPTTNLLTELFGDNYTVFKLPTVGDDAVPWQDANYQQAVLAMVDWALAPDAPSLPAAGLASMLEHLVDSAGQPKPVPSIFDQILFHEMNAQWQQLLQRLDGQTKNESTIVPDLTAELDRQKNALISKYDSQLSADGKSLWTTEKDVVIRTREKLWSEAVAEAKKLAEEKQRRAEADLEAKKQRYKSDYMLRREASKTFSRYHPEGWRGGKRVLGVVTREGGFACCRGKENHPGCAERINYSMPEWNDSMWRSVDWSKV